MSDVQVHMIDPNTALPSSENYGIDAQYNLIDLASNKSVMTGTTCRYQPDPDRPVAWVLTGMKPASDDD